MSAVQDAKDSIGQIMGQLELRDHSLRMTIYTIEKLEDLSKSLIEGSNSGWDNDVLSALGTAKDALLKSSNAMYASIDSLKKCRDQL